jgi:hypothetical protein
MGYLELGVLLMAALGFIGFAVALAWIDAAPRRRQARETSDGGKD